MSAITDAKAVLKAMADPCSKCLEANGGMTLSRDDCLDYLCWGPCCGLVEALCECRCHELD